MTEAATAQPEDRQTRFFIFVPDEKRSQWEYVGSVRAHTREQAAKRHFGSSRATPEECCAVSEHAWKPFVLPATVRPEPERIEMPEFEQATLV